MMRPCCQKMGRAKRLVLCSSSRRYLQRFKCRRQWCRVLLQAMQSRDAFTCIDGPKPPKRMCKDLSGTNAYEFFFFFVMYTGLAKCIGSIIVRYYRLQDTTRVDLAKDSDSSDESSVHTPLDYDDPDTKWV